MAGLGECVECHGPLCVSGREVVCERCGHIHPDHPAVAGWKDPQPAPPAFATPAQDYAASIPDRLKRLEELVQRLLERDRETRRQGDRERGAAAGRAGK